MICNEKHRMTRIPVSTAKNSIRITVLWENAFEISFLYFKATVTVVPPVHYQIAACRFYAKGGIEKG